MALTHCPECTKQVSDQASSCPHCGYPFTFVSQTRLNSQPEGPNKKISISIALSSILLIVGIGYIISSLLPRFSRPSASISSITSSKNLSSRENSARQTPNASTNKQRQDEVNAAIENLGRQLTNTTTPSWPSDLTIKAKSWSKSEYGLATWKLTIANSSSLQSYKDLHFKTTYRAQSGTLVDKSLLGHTEYVTISAGQTKEIQFTEFTHTQAHSAEIEIDNADVDVLDTLKRQQEAAQRLPTGTEAELDADFENARRQGTVEAYQEFLYRHHRNEKHYDEALAAIDKLLRPDGKPYHDPNYRAPER